MPDTQKIEPIELVYKPEHAPRATRNGNNAAWMCWCGNREPLLGRRSWWDRQAGRLPELRLTVPKYIETPARHSSDFCPECGHSSPENRKTQARFRCRECQHTENGDANAARNHLLYGTSPEHRVAVRRFLGGGDSSKTPSWRGQPGQGTGGKPGQRPGAATGPRTLVHPASRKGLSARPWDGYTGGRVRGSSTCGNQGACHQLMGLCHLFPHLTAWVGRQRGSWCSPYRPLPCARHGLARSAAVEEDLADGVPRAY